jgi:hypothetical protein
VWWTLTSLVALLSQGFIAFTFTSLGLPVLAYLALRWVEGASGWKAWVRSIGLRVEKADTHKYMLEERRAIYQELVIFSEQLEPAANDGAPNSA